MRTAGRAPTAHKKKKDDSPADRPLLGADLLPAILDSSPIGFAISEADSGVLLYANPAIAAFFGHDRDAALGKPTTMFYANPADRDDVRDILRQGGTVHRRPVRTKTSSNVERLCALSCRLIDYQGKSCVLAWIEDETERTQREREILSASRQVELLHQIAGICNRAVNFFDALRKSCVEIARGIGWPISLAYRLAHGDDALLEISSFTFPKSRSEFEPLRSSLIGRAFRSGEDLPGRTLTERHIIWVGNVKTDSGMMRFNTGEAHPIVSALGVPVIADDRVIAVLEFLSDQAVAQDEMTELTLSQISSELARVYLRDLTTVALQQARAEAESSSRAKASFLAAMSHEVRTPMNGVVGMVDLVLQTKLDDDQRFMLQTVMDSGRALITVINDILDFSKIEAGRLEIEKTDFSPLKIVEEVAFSLAPAVAQKGLRLTVHVDPAIPDLVQGDAVRLRQILSNLGSNAVKFSEQGEVLIKAQRLPSDDTEIVNVRFTVRDEGVGISAEGREKLFEEFSQADSSTTRRFGGTGLGLAICQRLTTLMGGEIGVNSLLGVGSEFHCTLPFMPAGASAPARSDKLDLAGLRVLIIAESEDLRAACSDYLKLWRADVVTATRLRDAVSLFQGKAGVGKAGVGKNRNSHPVDIIVIPFVDDAKHVAGLRQGFIDAGLMPYPRFVIGRNMGQAGLAKIPEVTLFDVNPVRRAALVFAVAVAAGRASPEAPLVEQPEPASNIKTPTAEEALAAGQLILVAEDNVANQHVIRRQLNRLGYACDMADDGTQALRMWHEKKYALLLTDCHMPNMDGFSLTTAIRMAERGAGHQGPGSRATIIAITANVLQGEAERCLATGMDDFLPKPVDLKTLGATLAKWMSAPTDTAQKNSVATPHESSTDAVLDLARILDAFGEIDDDARDYFKIFVDSVAPLIEQFQTEIDASQFPQARETIHKTKGAAANAGGREISEIMHDIERALAEQRHDHAIRRAPEIRPAWARLTQAIAQL